MTRYSPEGSMPPGTTMAIFMARVASISAGGALTARIGRAEPFVRPRVYADRLDLADPCAPGRNHLPAVAKPLGDGIGKAGLEHHDVRHPLLVETRRVDGLLSTHPEPHPVEDRQERRRNNSRAARRAGDEADAAIAQQNRGRHRAER